MAYQSIRLFGKKIITLIMTLFLVSVAAFLAFQIIPGDVVTAILGTEATPEREEQVLFSNPEARVFMAGATAQWPCNHTRAP